MSNGYDLIPDSEFGRCFRENFHHFTALNDIMRTSFHEWVGCGTYLMAPPNWFAYTPTMASKQELLFQEAKKANTYFEVGVHGGHSLLIVLMANPNVKITCVDICHYTHTTKCVDYLNSVFDNRVILHAGDSMSVLKTLEGQFDLIHIDGDHANYARVENDMLQAYRLSTSQTVFIFDDYEGTVINTIVASLNDKYKVVIVPACAWYNCLAYRKDRIAQEGDY